ncbi:unnamed protein product, partial [Discosporangium mesarthrocarpum]
KLEAQAKLARDALFRKKKDLQRLQTDLEEDGARLEGIQTRAARTEEQNARLEAARDQVEAELDQQREALLRVEQKLQGARKAHRDSGGSGGGGKGGGDGGSGKGHETLTEKASRAGALRDTAAAMLYALGQLASEFPEIHDQLHNRLREQGLRVPSAPPQHGPVTPGYASSRLLAGGGSRPSSTVGSEAPASSHSSRFSQQRG